MPDHYKLSGKTKKVKTGGRINNGRYEHTPQTQAKLNEGTRANRTANYKNRVAKGQMTQETANKLTERDKRLNFH